MPSRTSDVRCVLQFMLCGLITWDCGNALWAWSSFLTSNLDSAINQTTLPQAETTARWAKHVGMERAEEAVRVEDEVEAQALGALRKEWTLTRRRQTRRSPPRRGNVSSPTHRIPRKNH